LSTASQNSASSLSNAWEFGSRNSTENVLFNVVEALYASKTKYAPL